MHARRGYISQSVDNSQTERGETYHAPNANTPQLAPCAAAGHGMPHYEERDEEYHKVHDHVPGLRRKEEPRAVEVAARAGQLGGPLRLGGDAAHHAQHDEDAVAASFHYNLQRSHVI